MVDLNLSDTWHDVAGLVEKDADAAALASTCKEIHRCTRRALAQRYYAACVRNFPLRKYSRILPRGACVVEGCTWERSLLVDLTMTMDPPVYLVLAPYCVEHCRQHLK